MTVCASNWSVPPRSSSAMSSQPSSAGWRSYQANSVRPSVTPVATNTVALNPCSASTGSACSADVQVAVVEVEADGALGQLAGLEQVGHLDDVENLVSGRGEVLHLLAKAPRMYRELVAGVRHPVVEENSQAAHPAAPA